MKKLLALLLAVVMVACLFAGCTPSGDENPGSTGGNNTNTQTSKYKVAMITDYGDITDQSFNQTTYEAVKAFCETNSLSYKYFKPESDSTDARIAMVDAAVADGYNVIVMPGFAFGEALVEVADVYPDVKFVALDVAEGEGGFTATENVTRGVPFPTLRKFVSFISFAMRPTTTQ